MTYNLGMCIEKKRVAIKKNERHDMYVKKKEKKEKKGKNKIPHTIEMPHKNIH